MPEHPPSQASPRGLLLLLATYAVVSASFINYFCRTFDISRWLIAVHVPAVVALLAAALLLPALLLGWFVRARVSAATGTLLAGVVSSALLLLYAANFASNMWLGSNITHELVRLGVEDWWNGGGLVHVSAGVLAVFALIAIAVIAGHLAMTRAIADALAYLGAAHRRRTVAAVAIVIAAASGVFAWQLSVRTARSEFLSSDPLLALMRQTISVQDERTEADLARIRESDAICRADAAGPPPAAPANVIVIIVDSLRADHLPAYGYPRPTTPFLSSLQAAGQLDKVSFATSACAESNCGIIATLASKTLVRQTPGNFKLPNLLADRGYDSYFILSGNHDWKGLRELYGNEHTLYFDGRDSSQYARSDDRVIEEGMARVPDAARPSFFYFHLMSAHLVGTKLPEFRRYEPSGVSNDWGALFAGTYDRETVINNYDNGVLQADDTIRRIFETLRRKRYLDDAVVMILSDHGEGLGDRGRNHYGHVTSLYQEFIKIPLLIYDTSDRHYANLEFATQVDVAPTVTDRLGIAKPACWQGVSMFEPSMPRATFHQTSLDTPCYALIDYQHGRLYKYMKCFLGRREGLYDLNSDPGETADLRDTADPALLARMREQLEQARAAGQQR